MAFNDFWTKKEDDLLMQWADMLPCSIIANKLNYWHEVHKTKITRSLEAVRWRMNKLGLSVKPELDNMSASEWARQLNVTRATITYWIKKKGLTYLRLHNDRLVINLNDMVAFAQKEPEIFDKVKPEIVEYFALKKG